MVGGVAEINGSQQLPRPAVLVPCACVSAAQAETLRYRCSLCAVTLHRGASRLQKMTETSVKASIFSAPVSVWLPFAATFHVTQASGVAGKRRGEQRATICVSTAFLCKPTAGEPFFYPLRIKSQTRTLQLCLKYPQVGPEASSIQNPPSLSAGLLILLLRMLTLCLKASRDLLGCKKKKKRRG